VPIDPTLAAERSHLTASRAALARMRAETAALTPMGGNAVSTEYLKQLLYRRMRALEDDPTVPLFFGRLDYAAALGAEYDETCYIGRRHVTGEVGGEPLVMDWRARMAVPFYRARPGEPMGVSRRRRFGFRQGVLTAYEDEFLAEPGPSTSTILQDEIERPRTGPMRDIVATIQPDQDVLVRTDLQTSMCIQGAPGTGKTAVGLHRAAYLLFHHRDQLARSGVLVVGPNESFLGYIADVLPALGEIDATQSTALALVSDAVGLRLRAVDDPAVATIKGDARMAAVLSRAVWSRLTPVTEMLTVPRGSRQIRLPAHQVQAAVDALRNRGVRYEAGRRMLPQRLAHDVLVRLEAAGDVTDDRVQDAVARSAPVRAACAAAWPVLDGTRLLFDLWSDPDALAAASAGILSAEEQAALLSFKPPRTPGAARWSAADLVLLDEIADLLNRTGSVGHVILDEAQDLSPMALRAVGRRAATGSVTVLGDLAQATTPWGVTTWAEALAHLGKPDAVLNELIEGFRVPGSVLDFAARLLPHIAPTLKPPRSVRRSRGDLAVLTAEGLPDLGRRARAVASREGTIGVIVADPDLAAARAALEGASLSWTELGTTRDPAAAFEAHLDLVPATLAKGLEFDHVIVLEPAHIVAAESDELTGWRRLYVCLTRAVSSLVVLAGAGLPEPLR
jgi:DNA helicase IV